MPLNLDAVGVKSEPRTVSWDSNETLLYAVGVGAGQDNPLDELAFTTENSHDVPHRVLPAFGVILTQFRGSSRGNIGTFDPAMLVHAEQEVELFGPIPASGTIEVTSTVTGMYDKGKAALVATEATGTLPGAAAPLIVTRSAVFIRGEGGFGVTGPSDSWVAPEREPDRELVASTRPDQALLYRLSGDHNPLHTDPVFAARAGFPKPILHGMCTYGVVSRVLLNAVAGGDPERFHRMYGRFSKPVFPGETLSVRLWEAGSECQFQVVNPRGEVVLDRGVFAVRAA